MGDVASLLVDFGYVIMTIIVFVFLLWAICMALMVKEYLQFNKDFKKKQKMLDDKINKINKSFK